MSAMVYRITSLVIVYSTVYSGTDQRKHQSSASLDFVWGIHRSPVNSPHKGPVTRKTFPFYDVIMRCLEMFVMNDRRNDARWLYYQRVIEDITKMWSIYTVTLCSQNIRTVVFLYFVFCILMRAIDMSFKVALLALAKSLIAPVPTKWPWRTRIKMTAIVLQVGLMIASIKLPVAKMRWHPQHIYIYIYIYTFVEWVKLNLCMHTWIELNSFHNSSYHPYMCVLSTLSGIVDNHSPFCLYIYGTWRDNFVWIPWFVQEVIARQMKTLLALMILQTILACLRWYDLQ